MLPLHAASEGGAGGAVIAALLTAHPPAAGVTAGGLRPLAAWLHANASSGAEAEVAALTAALCADGALAAATVHDLVRVPEAAPLLRAATAAHPRLPDTPEPHPAPGPVLSALDAAHPACRQAMLSAGWLLRRYSLPPPFRASSSSSASGGGTRLHASEDAGADAHVFHRRVVLKFFRRRDRYEREVTRRAELSRADPFSADLILPPLRALCGVGVNADADFAEEAALRGLWPHLLVLPRADASLAEALASRPDAGPSPACGRDWRAARLLARALAACLAHVHEAGLIHANFTPRAAVRCGDSLGGSWKLIDLDAAVSHARGEYISDRVAAAYCPPELCATTPEDGAVWLRCVPERGVLEAWEPGSLKAGISFDMWSYGAVLYEIVAGRKLWEGSADEEEGLPQDALRQLAAWDTDALERALAPLTAAAASAGAASAPSSRTDALSGEEPSPAAAPSSPASARAGGGGRDGAAAAAAAALLRLLLHPSAAARPPSMAAVLDHPFLNPAGGYLHGERSSAVRSAALGLDASNTNSPRAAPQLPGSPNRAAAVLRSGSAAAAVAAAAAAAAAPPQKGAVEELADSLLSAVAGFNFSILTGGSSSAAAPPPSHAAPAAPPSPAAAARAHAAATAASGASGVPTVYGMTSQGGSPRFGSIGPPPPACVGPFTTSGLRRPGAYPAAAAAAAASERDGAGSRGSSPRSPKHAPPPGSGGSTPKAGDAAAAAAAASAAAAAAAALLPVRAWADPVPPPPRGTVAATRSLVGVPAIPGGVRSPPPSPVAADGGARPPPRSPAAPSPLGRPRAAEPPPFWLGGLGGGATGGGAAAAAAPAGAEESEVATVAHHTVA
jgi:hypothetical protein